MTRCRIQIIIELFAILAVIPLVTAEAIQSLFKDGVFAVPQSGGKAQSPASVRPAIESIFAPAVNSATCLIVSKCGPTVTMLRVVLTHRAPLSFTQIRPPAQPVLGTFTVFLQALFSCIIR